MSIELTKNISTAINGQNPSLFDYLRMKGEYSYPTDDAKVYASSIASMNLGDLQTHAMDKGIKPSSDRRRLEIALLNQFKSVMNKRKASKMTNKFTPEQIKDMEEKRRLSIERAGDLRARL